MTSDNSNESNNPFRDYNYSRLYLADVPLALANGDVLLVTWLQILKCNFQRISTLV
jgi:hypothetical protein